MKLSLLAVAVVAVAVVACGGDDGDTSPASTVAGEAGSGANGELDVAGSVDDTNLLVPRDYLQGEWCDSDGQTWSIEGDIARVEDTSGGVGEVPVDLAFIDSLDIELLSRSDNEFVLGGSGEETTFTRGGC